MYVEAVLFLFRALKLGSFGDKSDLLLTPIEPILVGDVLIDILSETGLTSVDVFAALFY